jgi:hypothetical protein
VATSDRSRFRPDCQAAVIGVPKLDGPEVPIEKELGLELSSPLTSDRRFLG